MEMTDFDIEEIKKDENVQWYRTENYHHVTYLVSGQRSRSHCVLGVQ